MARSRAMLEFLVIHRGDVFAYKPVIPRPGISTIRLVASVDLLNVSELLPVVMGIHVVQETEESPLVSRIGELGWAPVTTIERVIKSRLLGYVGRATDQVLGGARFLLQKLQRRRC
jgi:hypothetical protein